MTRKKDDNVIILFFNWDLLKLLEFYIALMLSQVQLPFPMDCLYADPERKVIYADTNAARIVEPFFSKVTLNFVYLFFQAYDVLGLYYGLGRTLFSPASVNPFSITT